MPGTALKTNFNMRRRSLFLLTAAFVILSFGCANTAYQSHKSCLQELDKKFQSGQIDTAQFKIEYVEESNAYNHSKGDNFRKVMAFLWEAHLAKM